MKHITLISSILTILVVYGLLLGPVLLIDLWWGKAPAITYLFGVFVCAFIKDGSVWLGKRFAPTKEEC